MNKKLGVIVPFRKRDKHLELFKTSITETLNEQKIPYEIIVVKQDDDKLFNRGKLLNVGFIEAKRLNCDYVVFHDVDMLPVDVDYGYSDIPLHLATNFKDSGRDISYDYFGGVTLFPNTDFEKINGYSNKYWGWGFEDDDLLLRCKNSSIDLDIMNFTNMGTKGKTIKLNGTNSYIKGLNNFKLSMSTIFISFYPENLTYNLYKEKDEYVIFSIPGYDLSVSYNSFGRYNFTTFDHNKNVMYVNSEIKPNYKTNICITIDSYNKEIKLYQDGVYAGKIDGFKKLYPYTKTPNFYIGVDDPTRGDNSNYFKGCFNKLAVFSDILDENTIYNMSMTEKIKDVLSLDVYYNSENIVDGKVFDLSGKGNEGEMVNCKVENLVFKEYKTIPIPYKRLSLFNQLTHENNGFVDNKWKDKVTRWNQLRFHNEISKDKNLSKLDGLSDLDFTLNNRVTDNNITQIDVSL